MNELATKTIETRGEVIAAHCRPYIPNSSAHPPPTKRSREKWIAALMACPAEIVASGVKLLDWDEINAEVAAMRSSAADRT